MKKKFLFYLLAIFIIPIVFIFFCEILFSTFYFFSKSKYFENLIENYNKKIILPYEIIEGEDVSFSNNNIKVAIFGGSSATGYASSISFAQIIESNIFTDKNITVHNYSKDGEPFVDFQAKILKSVIPYYDVLIVYAGHNELWQIIHSSIKKTSKPRIFPNGLSINIAPEENNIINERIKNITEYGLHGYIKPNKLNYNVIAERSRLAWFSFRALNKIRLITSKINKSNNKNQNIVVKDKNKYKFNHYHTKNFLTPNEFNNITADYKKTILDIIRHLRPNQKLILSTVLSNNLFPPLADVNNKNDLMKIENYEKYAKKSFKALLESDYSSLKLFIQKLPKGSNKSYLHARDCLGSMWENQLNNSNCLNYLDLAKKLESYPLRIVSEINTFIRGLKFNNVLIVDPIKILNNTDNFESYNNHFVDFQHPSTLGHYLIANEILIKLFEDYSKPLSFSLDECDNLSIQKKNKKFILKPNTYVENVNMKKNIRWLNEFIKMYSSEYYQYYLNSFKLKVITKQNNCNISLKNL